MATGDVFKVSLLLSLDAVQCRPGFYLIEGSGLGGANPVNDCGQDVVNTLGVTPLAGFVQNLNYAGVHVEDVQPGTSASLDAPVGPFTGTIADDNPPPPQDSMLCTLYTAARRSPGNFAAEGRIYMPGIYSTGQVSGFITSTLFDALSAFFSILNDRYVADGTVYQMHVVSFTPGSSPRTIRATNAVTDMVVRNQVAIQRRRRPGRGI